MILPDTSIWIGHFRRPDEFLANALRQEAVVMHPFVLGELELGGIPNKRSALQDLEDLPVLQEARPDEARRLLRSYDLVGRGIGYVDLHLLTSAKLSPGTRLWTRDGKLNACAELLGLGFSPAGQA